MTPIAQIALKVLPEQTPEPDFAALKAEMTNAKDELVGIRDLYNSRKAELEESIRLTRENWELSNAELITLHADAAQKATDAEEALRVAIVETYKARGDENRQIAPELGLSIQVRKTYEIADREKMLHWAKARPEFLVPNERTILEAAKNPSVAETLGINFVEMLEEPTAVIKK
jgi:hypothetical protein